VRSAEEIERFFAGGGRALVLKGNRLERLPLPVEVVHRAHSGARELLVVTPRTASDPEGPRLR